MTVKELKKKIDNLLVNCEIGEETEVCIDASNIDCGPSAIDFTVTGDVMAQRGVNFYRIFPGDGKVGNTVLLLNPFI